jgi:hypothetical protein
MGKGDRAEMRLNRNTVGAFAATATLLVGGGAAFASSSGKDEQGRAPCEARLERIAEQRGISVERLTAQVKARLLARIDAAEKAGRISSERAAKLRERVAAASICGARHHAVARIAARGMLRAAAAFLELDRRELRSQLPGTSLAALAGKQGKSVSAIEAAMVAPAKVRLARAVANGRITQARADAAAARLEQAAEQLAAHVFPKR